MHCLHWPRKFFLQTALYTLVLDHLNCNCTSLYSNLIATTYKQSWTGTGHILNTVVSTGACYFVWDNWKSTWCISQCMINIVLLIYYELLYKYTYTHTYLSGSSVNLQPETSNFFRLFMSPIQSGNLTSSSLPASVSSSRAVKPFTLKSIRVLVIPQHS